MAADAWQLIDHVFGRDSRVHIVGVSLGGMIAQQMALMHIERCCSLFLGSTSSGRPRRVHAPPPATVAAMMAAAVKPSDDLDEIVEKLMHILFSKAFIERPDLSDSARMLIKRSFTDEPEPTGYFAQAKAAASHHVSRRRLRALEDNNIPVTLLSGTDDKIVTVRCTYYLATTLPSAELVLIEGAGHGVQLETAEEFNRAMLRTFYRGLPAGITPPLAVQRALEKREPLCARRERPTGDVVEDESDNTSESSSSTDGVSDSESGSEHGERAH